MKCFVQTFAILFLGIIALSCQKETEPKVTMNTPSTVELSVDGSSESLSFTSNRDWTATCSDSWISISPSSGKASNEAVTVIVKCNANTSYDERVATVTISAEDIKQTVAVRQPAKLAILVPTREYNLGSEARVIEVKVQANIQYDVAIYSDWIKHVETKGLTSNTLSFSIEENQSYDMREGVIIIRPNQSADVSEQIISVKQAQKDALIVDYRDYSMPYGGGEIEVTVDANVGFNVKPNVDWIRHVETKALTSSTVRLVVDENQTYEKRNGVIAINQIDGTTSQTITVNQDGRVAVSSIELNKTHISVERGYSETLVATVNPQNATDKTVSWSSSDNNIAWVEGNGKVRGKNTGTATITAKAGDKTASCDVEVVLSVQSIELNQSEVILDKGSSTLLVVTFKPKDTTQKDVTWTSSNTEVVSVDEEGKVTALDVGTATITATVGEKTATCKVTVIIAIQSISLNQSTLVLEEGSSENLVATVHPDNATDPSVSWSSSDESIATVDENGKVTAIKEGTVIITAKAGDKTASCEVTVTIKINAEDLYGLWECVSSLDQNDSEKYEDLIKGESLTILSSGTYYSSSSILGESGSYSVDGNTFTATTVSGDYYYAVFSIKDGFLTLTGNANGFDFTYVFMKIVNSFVEDLYGDWKCTYSLDKSENETYKNILRGETLSIYSSGDYTSSDSTLGTSGTYSVMGSNFIATTNYGDHYSAKFYIKDGYLTLTGNANGFDFTYEFKKTFTNPQAIAVDLGLSVKWGSFNVGATSPEEFGDYYAWGDTEPYYVDGYAQSEYPIWRPGKEDGYVWSNYKWWKSGDGRDVVLTKYVRSSRYGKVDGKKVLDWEDDAAFIQWGGNWRMPTTTEFYELKNNCTWEWAIINGVEGYRVQSNIEGFTNNWIFLPAAGSRSGTKFTTSPYGDYWSSNLDSGYDAGGNPIASDIAGYLMFDSSGFVPTYCSRRLGYTIRPVCK